MNLSIIVVLDVMCWCVLLPWLPLEPLPYSPVCRPFLTFLSLLWREMSKMSCGFPLVWVVCVVPYGLATNCAWQDNCLRSLLIWLAQPQSAEMFYVDSSSSVPLSCEDPFICAMNPGVVDSSWSTETHCPGAVIVRLLILFVGGFVCFWRCIIFPYVHAQHFGINQLADLLGIINFLPLLWDDWMGDDWSNSASWSAQLEVSSLLVPSRFSTSMSSLIALHDSNYSKLV